jgi:hypothetical protein
MLKDESEYNALIYKIIKEDVQQTPQDVRVEFFKRTKGLGSPVTVDKVMCKIIEEWKNDKL